MNTDAEQIPETWEVSFKVANGMFRCSGCIQDIKLKADGRDHKVKESAYCDTASVQVVDARTVEITVKKAGNTMFTETDTVSPDGLGLTQVVKDTTEHETVTIETLSRRVAQGPAGSHSLSGSWRVYKYHRSENGSIIRYKCTADGFSAETPLGEKFDAKFDGKFYPVEDDPGHGMVSVKLLSPNSVEITSKRNGKIAGILHLTVAPDGKSIHVILEHKDSKSSASYEMLKQR